MSEANPSGDREFQNPLDSWEQPWNKMTYFWHNDPTENAPVPQPIYDANTANIWANPQVGWGNQALHAWGNPWNKMNFVTFADPSRYMAPLSHPISIPIVGYSRMRTDMPDMWRNPTATTRTVHTERYACKVIEVGAKKDPPSPFMSVSDNGPCEMVGAIRPPPLRNVRAPSNGCPKCHRSRGASFSDDVESTVIPRSFPSIKRLKANRSHRILKIKKSPNIVRFDRDYIRRWKEETKRISIQDMFREIRESRSFRVRQPGHPDLCRFCHGPLSAFGFCRNCSIFSSVDIRASTLPTVQEVNESQSSTEPPFPSCVQKLGAEVTKGGDDGDKKEGGKGKEAGDGSKTGDDGDANRVCLCYMTYPDSETGMSVEEKSVESIEIPVETLKPPGVFEGSDASADKSGDDEGPGRICLCGMDFYDDSSERALLDEFVKSLKNIEEGGKPKNVDKTTSEEKEGATRLCLCDTESEDGKSPPSQTSHDTEPKYSETTSVEGGEGNNGEEEGETVRLCLCIMEDWNPEQQSLSSQPSRTTPPERKYKIQRVKETADVSLCVHPSDVMSQDAEIQTTPEYTQPSKPKPTQTDDLPLETTQTQTEKLEKPISVPTPTQTEKEPTETSQAQTEPLTPKSSGPLRFSHKYTPPPSRQNITKEAPFGAAMNVGNASPSDITVVLYSNRVIVAEVIQRKTYCESILSQTWELPEDSNECSIRCFLGKGILLLLTTPPPDSFKWPFSSPLVCLGAPRATELTCKVEF